MPRVEREERQKNKTGEVMRNIVELYTDEKLDLIIEDLRDDYCNVVDDDIDQANRISERLTLFFNLQKARRQHEEIIVIEESKEKDLGDFERNEEEENLEIQSLLDQTKEHTYSEEMTGDIDTTKEKSSKLESFILVIFILALLPIYVISVTVVKLFCEPVFDYLDAMDCHKHFKNVFVKEDENG